MYSLYNKTSFQKFLQITSNNKLRFLVILIALLFGFFSSNVFAADSLRLTDNTIVRNLFLFICFLNEKIISISSLQVHRSTIVIFKIV